MSNILIEELWKKIITFRPRHKPHSYVTVTDNVWETWRHIRH